MLLIHLIAALSSSFIVSAHPHAPLDFPQFRREVESSSAPFSAEKFPDVVAAMEGNARFRETRNETLMHSLVTNGQKPPFMMMSCSDSRTPEATIFDSQPGTFFMERNIANQYKPGDENAQSVMAYGVRVLGVQHVVVMGHYGCGGIAAAIASAPKPNIDVATYIIQTWIRDIRALYMSSDRTEVVEMRTRNLQTEASGGTVEEPDAQDPGFRALVEENVKQQVQRISQSSVIINLNEEVVQRLNPDGTLKPASTGSSEEGPEEENTLIPVFVHGWVHDIETGEVIDLNISTGPAGFENYTPSQAPETEIPATPSESSEDRTAVATPTDSSEAEQASPEGSATNPAEPTVTSEPSSVEVKVHGSDYRAADPLAKIKRSLRRHSRKE